MDAKLISNTPHETITVPFSKIRPGHEYPGQSINSRTTYRDQDIEQVGRSLLPDNDGQLKPLLCSTHEDKPGLYFAFDGNRRHAGFSWDVAQKLIGKDHPVEIKNYGPIAPDVARRLSWAANEQVPLHPADRYAVFSEMYAGGKSPKDIASDRGMTVRAVEQSLAFGSKLAPETLDAWRTGEITQDLAKIFTLGDFEDQVEQLKKQRKGDHIPSWRRRGKDKWSERMGVEDELRKAFAGNEADAARLLKFVGQDAYLAEGGRIVEDLFGEKATSIVQDLSKLKRLAKKKLEERAEKLRAEGWSWVETSTAPHFHDYNYGKSKDKTKAGCVVRIAGSKIEVEAGLTKKGRGAGPENANHPREEKAEGYTADRMMEEAISGAVSVAILADQKLLMATFLAAAGTDDWQNTPVSFDFRGDPDLGITHAKKFDAALAEFLKVDQAKLAAIVVQTLAGGLSIEDGGARAKARDPFLARLDQDKLARGILEQFDYKAYFSDCGSKHLVKCIGEALGPDQQRQSDGKSKEQLVKFCVASVAPTGWLPQSLRTKAYKAPDPKRAGAELGKPVVKPAKKKAA